MCGSILSSTATITITRNLTAHIKDPANPKWNYVSRNERTEVTPVVGNLTNTWIDISCAGNGQNDCPTSIAVGPQNTGDLPPVNVLNFCQNAFDAFCSSVENDIIRYVPINTQVLGSNGILYSLSITSSIDASGNIQIVMVIM